MTQRGDQNVVFACRFENGLIGSGADVEAINCQGFYFRGGRHAAPPTVAPPTDSQEHALREDLEKYRQAHLLEIAELRIKKSLIVKKDYYKNVGQALINSQPLSLTQYHKKGRYRNVGPAFINPQPIAPIQKFVVKDPKTLDFVNAVFSRNKQKFTSYTNLQAHNAFYDLGLDVEYKEGEKSTILKFKQPNATRTYKYHDPHGHQKENNLHFGLKKRFKNILTEINRTPDEIE